MLVAHHNATAKPLSTSAVAWNDVGSVTTWNPADKDAVVTLSNGNLTAAMPGGGVRATSAYDAQLGNYSFPTFVLRWQATFSDNYAFVGFAQADWGRSYSSAGVFFLKYAAGNVYLAGSNVDSGGTGFAAGDTIDCALDPQTLRIYWFKNGVLNGRPFSIPPGVYYPAATSHMGPSVTANFGATAFTYSTLSLT